MGRTIPNQSLLVNSIVLQEAKASSEIENIITTNDALFKAFTAQTSNVGSSTKEVLRYREALWNGYEQLNKKNILSTNLFVQLVQIIKKNQAGIRNKLGTALTNATTGEIIYTSPDGESVIREKLKNLEDYIHSNDDIDPLIKLALIHYQFEAIHPFSDGNGRTGRVLLNAILLENGYPPLIIRKTARVAYFSSLEAFDKGYKGKLERFLLDKIKKTFNNFFNVYVRYL